MGSHFRLHLLSFFSDEVQIGPETVMTTLYTAKKYAVPALVQCFAVLYLNGAADHGILYYLFFSDEVQIGPETVMTTLYTAKKCAVPAH